VLVFFALRALVAIVAFTAAYSFAHYVVYDSLDAPLVVGLGVASGIAAAIAVELGERFSGGGGGAG